MSEAITNVLRETAASILKDGTVEMVIGYEAGTVPLRATPCFITDAADVDRLVWNPYCSNNLAVYLPTMFRAVRRSRNKEAKLKVAVVAKGCDAKSLLGHVKERQVGRDEMYVLGIPCTGVVDTLKVEKLTDGKEITGAVCTDGTLTVKGRTFEKTVPLDEVLRPCCEACEDNNPVISDKLLGKEVKPIAKKDKNELVNVIEAMKTEDKWDDFQAEIAKCVRCYACRNACPLCYCTECFVEQSLPQWIGITDDLTDTSYFQLIRVYHTAGRCVDCGACVTACPMGVDLRKYTQKLNKDVESMFGYKIGSNETDAPALAMFKLDDPEPFITEPK